LSIVTGNAIFERGIYQALNLRGLATLSVVRSASALQIG